jgi:RHS repeat-associated protein
VYDGDNVVGDFQNGTLARTYVTPFLDQNLGMTDLTGAAPATYYYSQDGLGSVRTLTDGSGMVANRYDYTAFGQRYAPTSIETVPQRYQFTGREASAIDSGLIYYRYRHYTPGIGRFTARDPIGYFSRKKYAPQGNVLSALIEMETDGVSEQFRRNALKLLVQKKELRYALNSPNLYLYPHNNPLNYTDPMGMEGDADCCDDFESQWTDAVEHYCSEHTGIKKWLCEKFIGALVSKSYASVAECQVAKNRCDIDCAVKYSDDVDCLAACLADCALNYANCVRKAKK